MGLFDKMFGRGAAVAEHAPDALQRFNQLKHKYQPVLMAIEQQRIQVQNLHVQDNKLFIRGVAPSDDAKAEVWTAIKRVNPAADDITADFTVRPTAPAPAPVASARTYTVKSGDTLSKISKEFYGDAHEYMRIFYANRDKLTDPDKIQVGQVLLVPPDTDE
jgi:nucleoid-associated protein YgaU